MPYLLAGLVIVVVLLFATRWFAQANPQVMARRLRLAGGLACMLAGGLLMSRGLAVIGGPLSLFGVFLLFGQAGGGWPGGSAQTPGKISRVTTDHLEMELDHDTGQMQGRVLKGQFFGHNLEDLTPADVALLWQECRYVDPQSAELLAAYLDNTHATWRDDMARATQEGEEASDASPNPEADGTMSVEEAYEVLGLDRSATADDVRRAHRDLMHKMHPDHGGSSYLAVKINTAKDLLLSRLLH